MLPYMPLNPDAKDFLQTVARAPSKPLAETSVAEMREAVDALVPFGFEREEVAGVQDMVVGGVRVRRYVPDAESLGTLVYVHGGSFMRCGLDTHDTLCRRLANRSGCTTLAVDFTLAPEATYPEQLDEIGGVIEALIREDPTGKIFLGGESSGGCIAAATALRLRDNGRTTLGGLVLLLPLLDRDSGTASRHDLINGYGLSNDQMQWMFHLYAPRASDSDYLVYPFRAPDLSGMPPTIVVTAEFDPLRDEGKAFADRVEAAGAHVDYECIPGVIHHAVLVPKKIPAGSSVIDTAATFLRKLASPDPFNDTEKPSGDEVRS